MRTITNTASKTGWGGTATAKVPERPATFEARMRDIVVGQDEAIVAVARALKLYKAGFAPDIKPIGVFLFLGPTGVGKTLFAEALAEVLHGDRQKVLRVNMNEFQRAHEAARLIGAPPGYLGHRETTPLLAQARLNVVTSQGSDVRVVLLDEIEKADSAIFDHFLTIFDEGRLQLGDNTETIFRNVVFILTSNLGTRELSALAKSAGYGRLLGEQTVSKTAGRATIDRALKAKFKPEFLNRITATVLFEPLTKTQMETIVDRELARLQAFIDERLGLRSIAMDVDTAVKTHLVRLGMSPEWGAREVCRLIQRDVLGGVADHINEGNPERTLRVKLTGGQVVVAATD